MDALRRLAFPKYRTVYKCRDCGATSYQPVIDRAANGALVPTGQYKCTGCRHIFSSVQAWKEPRRSLGGTNSGFAASRF